MASSIDGNRLKQLREENGYTLDEVAKETYNTVYTVQSWEEGWALSNPSSGEISSLAEMFDMSEDDLRDEINADEEYDGDNENKPFSETIGEAIGTLISTAVITTMERTRPQREKNREIEHKRQLELQKIEAEKEIEIKRIEAEKEKERQRISEIKRRERKEWRRKHRLGIIISVLSVLLVVILAIGVFEYQNYISVGYTEGSLIGLTYEDAVQKLEEQGFSNINLEEKSDLLLSDENKANTVSDVSIKDIDLFDINTKCRYNTEITIVYHTLKMVNAPLISKDSKGLNFLDVQEKFETAGFVNIKYDIVYDIITGWIMSDGEVEFVKIDGNEDFDCYDDFRPDAEVVVTYHTLRKNKPEQ